METNKKVQFSKTMALATVLALSGIAASQATTESASAATGTLGDYVTKEFLSDYSKLSPMEGTKARIDNCVVEAHDFRKPTGCCAEYNLTTKGSMFHVVRQPVREGLFTQGAGCQIQDGPCCSGFTGRESITVSGKKDVGEHKTDPFVSIDKGVITHDARGIGGRQLDDVGAPVCGELPRTRHRRLE